MTLFLFAYYPFPFKEREIKLKTRAMDKEDIVVEIQSRLGLTEEHLSIDFKQENKIRITFDLNGYEMKRPPNLDPFWEKLQDLPSTQSQENNPESKEVTVDRQELESLLSQLDPPIQA